MHYWTCLIVIGFSEYFQNHILHIMVFKMNRIFRKFKHMYLQCGCKNEFLWWVDWKQLQQRFSQISHNFLPRHFEKKNNNQHQVDLWQIFGKQWKEKPCFITSNNLPSSQASSQSFHSLNFPSESTSVAHQKVVWSLSMQLWYSTSW